MDFGIKNGDIVEIAVNPRFCTNGIYETLVNQGFPVRWMTEDELNTEDIFEIEVETNS